MSVREKEMGKIRAEKVDLENKIAILSEEMKKKSNPMVIVRRTNGASPSSGPDLKAKMKKELLDIY